MTGNRQLPQSVTNVPPRRILIVDDNEDAVKCLGMLLQMEGYEVAAAHSGEQALKVGREQRVDIVLLDIAMPGLDGYHVAAQLRQHMHTQHALIIAITGYGYDSDRRRSQQAGFDLHFVKPVDVQALLSAFAHHRTQSAEQPLLKGLLRP